MAKSKHKKTGFGIFYGDDEDVNEVQIRLGRKRSKSKRKCAKVVVEFEDGSKRKIRICEDSVEEYTEE